MSGNKNNIPFGQAALNQMNQVMMYYSFLARISESPQYPYGDAVAATSQSEQVQQQQQQNLNNVVASQPSTSNSAVTKNFVHPVTALNAKPLE